MPRKQPLGLVLTRRRLLRWGALAPLGLTSGVLEHLRSQAAAQGSATPHRHNACVFLFLFGGPSQIDLWDMKPQAPAEIRGQFRPVATRVPGVQICEHLPRLAQVMDRLCLIRSMTHRMNVHGPAISEVMTGRPYPFPPTTDQERPEDWPSLAAMVTRFGRPQRGLPPAAVLPWHLQFPAQPRLIAGQRAGRMGRAYDPLLLPLEPKQQDQTARAFRLPPHFSAARLQRRRELWQQLDSPPSALARSTAARTWEQFQHQALDLLAQGAGRALDLEQEPESLRRRYGNTTVGQSLLLARRLVEAGVSLVTVNWQDPTKISNTNTCWDTHRNNFPKLKDLLCPIFDQAFSAFIEDLDRRGLLETTLVVAVGEFGRTPRMGEVTQSNNTKQSGRDHWPHAFTALVAGGGVAGGQVYGRTDRHAAYVEEDPVAPADLTATILHHLGIDPAKQYYDPFQQVSRRLSTGRVLRLG